MFNMLFNIMILINIINLLYIIILLARIPAAGSFLISYFQSAAGDSLSMIFYYMLVLREAPEFEPATSCAKADALPLLLIGDRRTKGDN